MLAIEKRQMIGRNLSVYRSLKNECNNNNEQINNNHVQNDEKDEILYLKLQVERQLDNQNQRFQFKKRNN
ncbi:hypothetical protein BLOT_006860 [Blomia tropicalis]|nr:hypothetical protein BLOT_006860 [Blomia tropicalis]